MVDRLQLQCRLRRSGTGQQASAGHAVRSRRPGSQRQDRLRELHVAGALRAGIPLTQMPKRRF